MTKSEHIRELYAFGRSRDEIADAYGYSRAIISHALTHIPRRPAGRPRKLARCEHCGQPIPAVNARA